MDVVSIGETMVSFTPNTNGQMRYAKQFTKRVAGAETNTLIGLAKLGHQTGWISSVGNDEFGFSILSSIRGEGVDTSQVNISLNSPTGLLFKEYLNEDHIQVHYYRNYSAASKLTPNDISEEYIAKSKYLYITGITPALSESCKEAIFYAINIAKQHKVPVVFDPNLRTKLWDEVIAKKTLLAIAEKSNIILPGLQEGKFLFNESSPQKIAQSFHDLSAEKVVIKLGEKGAFYSTGSESEYVPAFHIKKVVDPVGAGDGFAAGFISGLLDELPISEAVARACIIGAVVTTVSGDIEGLLDREGLAKFTQSFISDDVLR
ncbi:sugar kinase [Viridibacillus arvi]|uniref:sugar kinase n=1 Tax=Viridibacillus arvi TaxID=263475 RepID=UPI003CFF42BF